MQTHEYVRIQNICNGLTINFIWNYEKNYIFWLLLS